MTLKHNWENSHLRQLLNFIVGKKKLNQMSKDIVKFYFAKNKTLKKNNINKQNICMIT